MTTLIKITLAILLLLCLMDMPYGYYQLVRWAAMVGFALLANEVREQGDNNLVIVYIGLALLFQPLIKLPLGRPLWNMVDVLVAVGLIGTLIPRASKQKKE